MKLGVNLDEKDVEVIKGDLNDIKFIRKFLQSRDITINEVIFVPSLETLFFTDKCLRDTQNATGILSANHVGTLRRDFGRIIASPRGMTRLIRFLTEGKIKSIYLPNWWVVLNKEEAERSKQGVLRAYGLVLTERYKDEKSLQMRFMKILNELAITNLKNFDTFKKEQEILFELSREEKFLLEKKSFKEIQEGILSGKGEREKIKIELKKKRESCRHKDKTKIICGHCAWRCAITKCSDCDWVEIIPSGEKAPYLIDDIFCNSNYLKADVYWDKNGFFPNF